MDLDITWFQLFSLKSLGLNDTWKLIKRLLLMCRVAFMIYGYAYNILAFRGVMILPLW